ncbi:polysaccharide lyase family 8 super-sandwich domain-containing protein [Gordoniibacillus kamchatkensis]|uniref:polysaccharide lyase family 8 super-sandwich domain-containing protein n=1 Tax=Gordoniibacillus kamchatkensis TaxID=1590651 RepID=UPI00069684FA|nr:polysaccharide lyase family 8 super-sandwich domain-containing protein [Paenibacillus sp. VKM B-2647]
MKKRLSILMVICLLFSLLPLFAPGFEGVAQAAGGPAQQGNLLQNAGFESVTTASGWTNNVAPVAWTSPWKAAGAPVFTADNAVAHTGQNSVRVDAQAASRMALETSSVPVAPGSTYKLGIWIKTSNLVPTSGGGAYVRVQFLDSTGVKVSGTAVPNTAKVSGTSDWTYKEMIVTVPGGTTPAVSQLKVEPYADSFTGTVWFDDVSLMPWFNLTLDQAFVTLLPGKTAKLTPVYDPANTPAQTLVWSSSNPDVATVDNSGNVTGQSLGVATITAQTPDGLHSASSQISVEPESNFQQYDALRLKWFDKLTGGAFDRSDPGISAYLSNLVNSVTNANQTGFWDTMNKSATSTYLWSDLASTSDSAQISTAYGRLRTMALAYAIDGSSLYRNESLKNDILSGLDWMYANRFNEGKTEYGNWWDWEIGTPQILNDAMVLMYDALTPSQLGSYIRAIDRFVPDPQVRTINKVTETGANLLDKDLVVIVRGIVGRTNAKISQGRDGMSPAFPYVTSGDGFYTDGSFIQHTNIAYTGSYGAVLLNDMANLQYLLGGSLWTVTDPNVNNVYDWVTNGFAPLLYKGAMMDMARGRAISRSNSQDHDAGRSIIASLVRLAQGAPSDKAAQIKSMVKAWIQADTTFADYYANLPIYDITLIRSLMNDAAIAPASEPAKNQVFAAMDRVVHLRPGFGFGIGMFSNRISAFEYGNGENSKGWYTGIGATYLYNNDLTQFSDNYWPTVDSSRLPGTTTDGSTGTLKDWASYMNPRTWVGGSSLDGLYGAAGMDFSLSKTTGSSLQGKKSWFMFDGEIVALGTGISSQDNRSVETIVDNRKLNGNGDNLLTVGGEAKPSQPGWSETMSNVKWANLEGNVPGSDIGYYFPEGATIYGLREARTGAWKDINTGGSAAPITRNYLSLAFEHGVSPAGASYAYVVLPNKDAAATANYAGNPNVAILGNTPDVQAVKEKSHGITAANFWNPGTADFITARNPASVMVKEQNGELELAVSDPTQTQSQVTVELARSGLSVESRDSTVEVVQTSPTIQVTVNVAGSYGKTHVVTFKDTTPPVTTDDANPDWHNTAQTVHLTATDIGSGVAATYYSVDNTDFVQGNTIVLSDEGIHTIRYYSVDAAGNREQTKSAEVKIDETPPAVATSAATTAAAGQSTVTITVYHPDPVNIPFAITDALSGVAHAEVTLDGASVNQPVTAEPLALSLGDHSLVVTAADYAGNVTTQRYVLRVMMDIPHLREELQVAGSRGWITNQGILSSLLAKADHIEQVQDQANKR